MIISLGTLIFLALALALATTDPPEQLDPAAESHPR